MLGLASLAFVPQQTSPPSPVFRAGVDVVEMDVTVLDARQQPVPDLTASDFSVLEDGTPRRIVAFSVMRAPEARPDAASWMHDVAPDVTTNQLNGGRLMVIVMDDRLMPFDTGVSKAAIKVATSAIDWLGPSDQAAVIFTGYGRNQNLTTDHVALRKAVESLVPHPGTMKTDPGLVKRIADILHDAPVGRKILLDISPAPGMGMILAAETGLLDILRELQEAQITVYAFAPQGIVGFPGIVSDPPRAARINAKARAMLRTPPPVPTRLVTETGGRAVMGTNDPWEGVDTVFRDSRLYYLIGFERSAANDGKMHAVKVTVDRPGMEVRTRSGYVAPDPTSSAKAAAASKALASANPIDLALARGLPTGDIPLRVTVTPVAAPDQRNTVLIVDTEIGKAPGDTSAPSASTQRVELVASAFDADWHARQTEDQVVALSRRDGAAAHDVLSRLTLAHGRYDVRVAVDSEGHTASLFVDVDVPDLQDPDLALSGVFLTERAGMPVGPADAIADLVPVLPTTARTFTVSDRVTAFARVYEGRHGRLVPATVATSILDDHNRRVFQETSALEATSFARTRSADVSVDVPLNRLTPGDYLLTLQATAGKRDQQRSVRFSIQ